MRVRSHMCARPVRQWKQTPHVTWLSAETYSPSSTSETALPSATTVPQSSWPSVSGGFTRSDDHSSQRSMCRSVPQIEAASMRIRTSSGPGVGTGTSSSTSPASGPRFRTARIVSTAAR